MFGDLFLLSKNRQVTRETSSVFVPMFGDLFLLVYSDNSMIEQVANSFRPHVWGSFFISENVPKPILGYTCFRPHVWGSFFIAGIGKGNGGKAR